MNNKQRKFYIADQGGVRATEVEGDTIHDRPATTEEANAYASRIKNRRDTAAALVIGGIIFMVILVGIMIAIFGGASKVMP